MPRSLALAAAVSAAAVLAALAATGGAPARPAAVSIVFPQRGDLVSGNVRVDAEAGDEVDAVTFEWSRDGGGTWTRIGVDRSPFDGWFAVWRTGSYSGRALLRASESRGSGSTIPVRVDNAKPTLLLRPRPRAFSPNGDDTLESVSIRFAADEAVNLTLSVRDARGRAVFAPARNLFVSSRRLIRFHWYGESGRTGVRVRDGLYRVVARAVDRAGHVSTKSLALRVDTRRPRLVWDARTPGTAFVGPVDLRFWAGDESRALRLSASLADASGAVLRTSPQRVRAPGYQRLPLPLDVRGRPPLTAGIYTLTVAATDAAGNRSLSEQRRLVFQQERQVWAVFRGAGNRVSLTFDDCFEAGPWASVLDTLRRYQVKGTFFCPGQTVLANRELARRTIREGHAIGAHGWDHANFGRLSYGEALWRLRADREAWWDVARASPTPFFRPPYGSYTATTVAAARDAGFAVFVLWDVDPFDWKNSGSTTEANVLRATRSGSIVLMHTVGGTASVLPSIISRLRERGLELVGLPELAASGTPDSKHWPRY